MKIRKPWLGMTMSALCFVGLIAEAATQRQVLVHLSNDRNQDINVLTGLVDKSPTAKGLEVSVVDQQGQTKSAVEFNLAQIASPNGVVLAVDSGRPVVLLQGKIDPQSGGHAVLKYLTNVITGNYAECQTQVRRGANGQWHIINSYTGQPVSRGHIQTWTLGISAIKGVCPENFDFAESEY